MSLMYSSTNRIKFTDISERYAVPKQYKAKLTEVHGSLILYVVNHFHNTRSYKQKVVNALNVLTYCIMFNETPPFNWKTDNPIDTIPPEFDLEAIQEALSDYWLGIESIEWDVSPTSDTAKSAPNRVESSRVTQPRPARASTTARTAALVQRGVMSFTPKEDLYIQAPKYPLFDFSKPWLSMQDLQGEKFVIYTTLPEIPTRQNEISATTDMSKMTDAELMNLFPNHMIQTRAAAMYEPCPGIEYDDDLGCIIPIEGFTADQVRENIIKYPHFYKLKRWNEDVLSSFYHDIEIDGELMSVSAVWDSLVESKVIPKQSDFIKEYVVRRYLLERDAGVQHRYEMYGTLDPFLTLFMPPEQYVARGFNDVLSISKQCVQSRISFKQSRNPVLKRLNIHG